MDFAIFSLCNHTLATVGTFSWWVGWVAGVVTTYYTRFVDPSTTLFTSLKFDDFSGQNGYPCLTNVCKIVNTCKYNTYRRLLLLLLNTSETTECTYLCIMLHCLVCLIYNDLFYIKQKIIFLLSVRFF